MRAGPFAAVGAGDDARVVDRQRADERPRVEPGEPGELALEPVEVGRQGGGEEAVGAAGLVAPLPVP